jgi:hypothetical protein
MWEIGAERKADGGREGNFIFPVHALFGLAPNQPA